MMHGHPVHTQEIQYKEGHQIDAVLILCTTECITPHYTTPHIEHDEMS